MTKAYPFPAIATPRTSDQKVTTGQPEGFFHCLNSGSAPVYSVGSLILTTYPPDRMSVIHVFCTVPALVLLTMLLAGAPLLMAAGFAIMSVVGSVLLLALGPRR